MPRRFLLVPLVLSFLALRLCAADAPSDTVRGDRLRDGYFREQVKRIAESDLADIKTRDDWEKKRPEFRRQFLDMLGLWPLPPRADLHAEITGKFETNRFTVEKLHFQSSPGLYVTGNLYIPKHAKFPAPAVLYLCGHGNIVFDKVSYGSKVFYQRHPAWFAEHGYVCLILDTLELGEIPGEHHGTYRSGMWWWQALGYTPAGIECWNAMRALDYLETRKEVDAKRLGVTGRSGGGATSWWIAAADDRPQCIVPVAGIADLYAHVIEGVAPRLRDGVISGHCDCMYLVNMYRWDFGRVMALCAPRPLLLGNSDEDDIFPVAGYRRLADKVRRIYELYGAVDRFQLLETKGPHKDTPELRVGAFRWMNRWLKNDSGEVRDDEPAKLTPQQLKVFDRLPADAINAEIQESFLKAAKIELPQAPEVAREWWKGRAPELLHELRTRVFRNWPDKPPALNVRLAADVKHEGLRLRAYDFVSEDQVELRLWLMTAEKVEKPTLVVLNALDEAGWQDWIADLGPAFKEALQLAKEPKQDTARFTRNVKLLQSQKWAFAAVTPRGIGPTRWSETSPFDGKPNGHQIRRRFALLGQTLDGQRVWDARRALACLRTVADLKGVPLWLQGKNEMAGIALYASLFEPDVARLDLWHPPASHRQGPIFLNVLRVLDMPQAVALAFPRKMRLYVKDDAEAKSWEWAMQLQKALGQEYLQIRRVGE
ncbi:MAG TPA: prolyl oligopeptidase family serine peptidase [Gemmataceae bacterium]|nr:prolyl oligopeptidase family serine peptidase [Gemmataceae bacterium]